MMGGAGDDGHQAVEQLVQVGEDLKDDFHQKQRVLSFEEYFRVAAERPEWHLRDSSRYCLDAFDYYGTYEVERAAGAVRRFRLFDCEFAGGRDRLAGHEPVQNEIYRILAAADRKGRSNKLILLHGPNGSAKSTCVAAIARALEHFSRLDEGAVYRFNWVFPSGTHTRGGIGFKGSAKGDRLESHAHLPEEFIDARLTDELRDHPLLLIPKARRRELLEQLLADKGSQRTLPDNLKYGELSHRNREIFEALLALYQGDFHAVLRHVQVERFFLSRRYRTGLIVVEPKLHVDARTQQLTMDRSIEALPPALQTMVLFRYAGELVDANRGIIEFADLLKRPLESFKYLINTVELGRVGLDNAILYLDEVFIGSTNDLHLQAFRELPDFPSFKGRIELVRVGYLVDLVPEMDIYQTHFQAASFHVAPHAVEVAALWAIMTRLHKPSPAAHPPDIQPLVEKLSSLEKALLYHGTLPEGVEGEVARLLHAATVQMSREHSQSDAYEGHTGASPREVLMVLLNAAQDRRRGFLSPAAVFDEIESLSQMREIYPYLKREAHPGGYSDARSALQYTREYYLERLQDDLWRAVGLVPPGQIDQMLDRYVTQVSNWVKGEKSRNPHTGKLEEPDETIMGEMERLLHVDEKEAFRKDLMARIASWAMEHPDQRPVLTEIFAKERQQIVQGLFTDREQLLRQSLEDMQRLLEEAAEDAAEEQPPSTTPIPEGRLAAAREALDRLTREMGYNTQSGREAIRTYLKENGEGQGGA